MAYTSYYRMPCDTLGSIIRIGMALVKYLFIQMIQHEGLVEAKRCNIWETKGVNK